MVRYYNIDQNDPLNGILHKNKDDIEIYSSKENINDHRIYVIIDNNPENYSCLANLTFPYFEFSFKNNNTIKPTKYSYRSYNTYTKQKAYPKEWVVSGYYINKRINISTKSSKNFSN